MYQHLKTFKLEKQICCICKPLWVGFTNKVLKKQTLGYRLHSFPYKKKSQREMRESVPKTFDFCLTQGDTIISS